MNNSRGTPLVTGEEKEWRNLNPAAGRTVAIARARRDGTPDVSTVLQKSDDRRKDMLAEYDNQKADLRMKFLELQKKLGEDEADIDEQARSTLQSEDLHEYAKAVQVSTMKRSDFTQRKMREEKAARNNDAE